MHYVHLQPAFQILTIIRRQSVCAMWNVESACPLCLAINFVRARIPMAFAASIPLFLSSKLIRENKRCNVRTALPGHGVSTRGARWIPPILRRRSVPVMWNEMKANGRLLEETETRRPVRTSIGQVAWSQRPKAELLSCNAQRRPTTSNLRNTFRMNEIRFFFLRKQTQREEKHGKKKKKPKMATAAFWNGNSEIPTRSSKKSIVLKLPIPTSISWMKMEFVHAKPKQRKINNTRGGWFNSLDFSSWPYWSPFLLVGCKNAQDTSSHTVYRASWCLHFSSLLLELSFWTLALRSWCQSQEQDQHFLWWYNIRIAL